ncbi:hypothetical protein RE6C_00617 [Rhodopirellula europaea 6C]|uniref:Uncharacterized protein n=1 Tax=Rhodopirellula europaea 6C TaxID=1263867 RepID=M2BAC9_9BACT|nr:hypothetical protein RE6C_00617 [Rhodopirellula europaea 6C]
MPKETYPTKKPVSSSLPIETERKETPAADRPEPPTVLLPSLQMPKAPFHDIETDGGGSQGRSQTRIGGLPSVVKKWRSIRLGRRKRANCPMTLYLSPHSVKIGGRRKMRGREIQPKKSHTKNFSFFEFDRNFVVRGQIADDWASFASTESGGRRIKNANAARMTCCIGVM